MKKWILSFLFFGLLQSFAFAKDPKKIVVLLDWFANPNHAPLFVADQQGFFAEQGLSVELIGPADPSDPPKLVAAGKADIAITYEPQFIEQVAHGLPLIRIATLIDKPLNCLVVLQKSNIHRIADLKNKSIGYSNSGVTNSMLKVMLAHNGLPLDQVERINVHYDLTQALLAKRIDAVTGMMRNFELIQMELAGHPGRGFYPEDNGLPTYSELIFVVRKDQSQDPKFKSFLIALQKGVNYLQAHPTDTWKTFAHNHPELNDELNRRAWLATLPYFAKHPATFNSKSWLRFIVFMQDNGLIPTALPIQDYAIDITQH